jgi:glycosyltransferase involved in cell wall biosynthesis
MQTATVARALRDAGHDVTISCAFGQQGCTDIWEGIKCLPAGNQQKQYGQDMIRAHYYKIKPDVIFSHHDTFVFHQSNWKSMPWAGWVMVDGEPLMHQKRESLTECDWPIASSRWGQRVMAEAGIDSQYMPYMFDDNLYQLRDRDEARDALAKHWRRDLTGRYIVCVNSANVSMPGRKNLPAILDAWGRFYAENPDSILYMHTDPSGKYQGGFDLALEMDRYGVPMASVIFPDSWSYMCGMIPPEYLALVYTSSDLYLNPSKGEGFGMPTIEAQLCGCPVALTDYGPSAELSFGGHLMSGVMLRDEPGCSHCYVLAPAIYDALRWGREQMGNEVLRVACANQATQFGTDRVMNQYMNPLLKMIEADLDQWGREKYQKGWTP